MEPTLLASIPKGRSHQKMDGLVSSTKTAGLSRGDPEPESHASGLRGHLFWDTWPWWACASWRWLGTATLPTTVALALAVCVHPPPRPPILWVKLTVPQITAHVGIIMEHKDIHLKLQFSSTSAFLLSSP